jgi:hypothetical protein
MTDRLGDLKRAQMEQSTEEAGLSAETGPIRSDIEKIRAMGRELEVLRDAYLATNNKAKQAKHDAKLQELEHLTEQAMAKIKIMEQRTAEDRRGKRINATVEQIRKNVTNRLTKDLLTETQQQWDAKQTHDLDVENQVARRIRVRYTDKNGVHKTEEESLQLARVMVRGKRQDYLFLQARSELEDALSQYNEIMELRDEVKGLCALVNTLHRLTDRQARELQATEEAVDRATDTLKQGVKDLKAARRA